MEISIKNNKIIWGDLVGKETKIESRKVICTSYDSVENKLYIGEWFSETNGSTSVISTVDSKRCLEHLKLFGFTEITFKNIFSFSKESIHKSEGLIMAGFKKLIKVENNYSIDNIFPQSILLKEEIDYLLNNNFQEISLSEIK